jgi:hypothetical protein
MDILTNLRTISRLLENIPEEKENNKDVENLNVWMINEIVEEMMDEFQTKDEG